MMRKEILFIDKNVMTDEKKTEVIAPVVETVEKEATPEVAKEEKTV